MRSTDVQVDERHGARVVVGTDGSAAALRDVAYAAREAQNRGVPLELVHAVPVQLPTGAFPAVPAEVLQTYGRQVLGEAREAALRAAPDVETTCTLASWGRVESLLGCAADAGLLVLGSRHAIAAQRVWTGTTVTGVVAGSTCPVVVVPPEHVPSVRHGLVAVGLKVARRSEPLLEAAFEAAQENQSDLVVVHAWKLAPGYDDLVSDHTSREQWRVEQEARIRPCLADLCRSHPGVKVRMEVVHVQPAAALVGVSARADLLLVSRPVHGGYLHHLGSTARAVLREAHCPVEVVPPPAAGGRRTP